MDEFEFGDLLVNVDIWDFKDFSSVCKIKFCWITDWIWEECLLDSFRISFLRVNIVFFWSIFCFISNSVWNGNCESRVWCDWLRT